jgi:superfamily II DNA/RNA helicase
MNDLQLKVETLQNMLISIATGGSEDADEYKKLRAELIANVELSKLLPKFLQTNRTTEQFWQFIKFQYSTYAERRNFIWSEFTDVLNYLESKQKGVLDESTSKTIEKFNQDYINAQWLKALERKADDPEGAITSARTLIETTCKYILDEFDVNYKDDIELPKLYKLTAEKLNLAPDQHTEQIFKQILGGCQSVIQGLGSLRNKLSDSHGKRVSQAKPTARHAELAVNLAGTMTTFLLETYDFKLQAI